MILRCIAVDDEPLALDKIADYIGRVPFLSLEGAFEDSISALTFLQTHAVDLVFLDIQMPQLTGIQLAKVMPPHVQVIFTTAYSEYAISGYELNVTDYLLKPIGFDRLLQGAQKALDKATNAGKEPAKQPAPQAQTSPFLFVKTEFKLQKIFLSDITYIEGMKDYLMIHTKHEHIMTLQNFKTLLEKLPADEFVRVHKSFVVSLSHIDFIERNRISIGQALIPISDSYKDEFYVHLERRGLL